MDKDLILKCVDSVVKAVNGNIEVDQYVNVKLRSTLMNIIEYHLSNYVGGCPIDVEFDVPLDFNVCASRLFHEMVKGVGYAYGCCIKHSVQYGGNFPDISCKLHVQCHWSGRFRDAYIMSIDSRMKGDIDKDWFEDE